MFMSHTGKIVVLLEGPSGPESAHVCNSEIKVLPFDSVMRASAWHNCQVVLAGPFFETLTIV